MVEVGQVRGYCEECHTDTFFVPARTDIETGEVLSWECSSCPPARRTRYLDEPPEPRSHARLTWGSLRKRKF